MAIPKINSAHGSETRNIINELINLFNGMGYTYDEALQKAHDTLNEAKQTNDMNKDVQDQINRLIISDGESDAEVIQARGGAPLLKDRLDENESHLARTTKNIGSIEEYGGKADGITDNKTAFTTAFDSGDDIYLFLPKGKINTSSLKIPADKNIIIEGQGVGITELIANEQFINIDNTPKKTLNIFNDINKGDFIISLTSTSNINVNDLITFTTTENMEEDTYSGTKKRHTAKVKSVNVNEIKIDTPFPNNFSSDYTITADVYSTGKIIIKDMTVKGEYKGFFLDIEKTSDLELKNLNIVNTFGGKQGIITGDEIGTTGGSMQGIRISRCIDTKIDNVTFDCLAYGVMPTGGSVRTTVSNSYANKCRHIVAPTGGAQTTKVMSCTTNECWSGFDSHQTCYDTYHYDCISYNDDMATGLRGRYDYAENCSFDNSLGIYGDPNNSIVRSKHLYNVKVNGYIRADYANHVKLESVDIKGALYTRPLDELIIRDVKVEINDFTPINYFPPSDITYAVRLSDAETTIIDGLILKGLKSGISNGGGVQSNHNFKALNLGAHSDYNMVQMSNIIIDGFDVGINMPSPFDLEKYIFSNILIKNTVVGIDTSENYKTNVNIEKVFFKDCETDISNPIRLT